MGSENVGHGMVIKIRHYRADEDYLLLKEWWEKQGYNWPLPHHLSTVGRVIEVNNVPVCIGFLYETNSSIAWFEQVICNCDAPKNYRRIALLELIETMKKLAKSSGFELLFSSTNIGSYRKKLTDSGFSIVDK